jgi:hypothetical protein
VALLLGPRIIHWMGWLVDWCFGAWDASSSGFRVALIGHGSYSYPCLNSSFVFGLSTV